MGLRTRSTNAIGRVGVTRLGDAVTTRCRSWQPVLSFVRQGGVDLEDAKRRLLDRISSEIGDRRVIQAMERVPRDRFVPDDSRHLAYEDIPLPIGDGQTISQPFIVAIMLNALELRQSDRALEVGTGSGYQAALMAELVAEVVSVERMDALADAARERLAALGYANVQVMMAEERLGWERAAPYDAIIVAAAAPTLPRGLMEQLAAGGRLIVPVGSLEGQELMKVSRSDETFSVETMGSCRFVPLIGEGAWPEAPPKKGSD